MPVPCHQEIRTNVEGTFENAIVVRVIEHYLDSDLRDYKFSNPPEVWESLLQHCRRPLEFFGEDPANFILDRGGIEQFTVTGFSQLEDGSWQSAEDESRHCDVRVGNDTDHFLPARFRPRTSCTRRSTSSSTMPWRIAVALP